jgi:hypothetical protein
MSKHNPIEMFSLRGFSPTPIRIAIEWPAQYRQPEEISIRRLSETRYYKWTERRERALVDAWKSAHAGRTRQEGRVSEGSSYDYLVSNEWLSDPLL